VTQQSAQGSESHGGGTSQVGNRPTFQPVGGSNQPGPPNKAVGIAMIKFRAPPTFSGKTFSGDRRPTDVVLEGVPQTRTR
jgi:hypothetical protein